LLTNDCLDVRSFQCCKAQVSDLNKASGAIDEDVVTLEVPVDDGGGASVEEVEAPQDLPPPASDHLVFNGFQTTHVAVKRQGRRRREKREGGRRGREKREGEDGEEGGREKREKREGGRRGRRGRKGEIERGQEGGGSKRNINETPLKSLPSHHIVHSIHVHAFKFDIWNSYNSNSHVIHMTFRQLDFLN